MAHLEKAKNVIFKRIQMISFKEIYSLVHRD